MANVKISELPAGVPGNGSLIPGVTGGTTQSFVFSTIMAGMWGAADGPTVRALIGAGTSNLAIGTTGTTALAGNTAIPVASSTTPAALAPAAAIGVGTTWARADHAHAIPGVSVGSTRGTVLIQATQAASVATTVPELVTDFNALLTKLKAAGVIAGP